VLTTSALSLLALSVRADAADDRLPDLGMAHPKHLRIETTSDGRKLLRFSSIIVNVGAGKFELRGQRADGASTMTVQQRIFDSVGGHQDVSTDAIMYFVATGTITGTCRTSRTSN
jgi:hypothetical protein